MWRPLPFAFAIQIPLTLRSDSPLSKAILRPSGDQSGANSYRPRVRVSGRRPEPSARMIQRSVSLQMFPSFGVDENAIHRPSGDQAGSQSPAFPADSLRNPLP